jgi:hypothetical protein
MRLRARSRTLKAGRLLFANGAEVDCAILDAAPTGARIRVDAAMALPRIFELVIVGDGAGVRVELRWRRGAEAGVVFMETPRSVRLL